MFQIYLKNEYNSNRLLTNDLNRTTNKNIKKAIIIQEKYDTSKSRIPFRPIENLSNSFDSNSSKSKRLIITEKLNVNRNRKSDKYFETSESSSFDEDDDDDSSWHKQLTEDDMEFIINNTGFQSDQIKRWHTEFLAKCSTGLITNEQFKSYYRVLLPNDLNEKSKEEIIEKLFCLFDIDGDGCLSFTEFLISFWIRCKAPIKEKYTWIFNMLDEDRNGYLNYTELRNALTLCLNLNDLDELLDELNKERMMFKTTKSIEKIYKNALNDLSSDTDYTSDDYDSESSSSFLYISTTTTTTTKTNSNNNRTYDLYSRTAELVDDKLNETVHLLHTISQKNDQTQKSALSFDSTSSTSSFSYINNMKRSTSSDSIDSCNDLNSNVQIKRENFLALCEKYKLFRKLLLPIKYFYEEDFFLD